MQNYSTIFNFEPIKVLLFGPGLGKVQVLSPAHLYSGGVAQNLDFVKCHNFLGRSINRSRLSIVL